MSVAVLHRPPPRQPAQLLWLFLLASVAAHAVVLLLASRVQAPAPARKQAMELVMIEVAKPAPPPALEPPRPIPPRRPPVKLMFRRPASPPPKDVPPPEPQRGEPPPVVVGLTLQSTTTAGSFAAPVGNTLAGKTADKAADPGAVKPAATPLYELDSQPVLVGEVKIPYPEDARRQRIEGTVVLSVLVDETGRVLSAKVISGPGGGLDQAAARAVELFRFRPATRKGQPVATQIRYSYNFQLD